MRLLAAPRPFRDAAGFSVLHEWLKLPQQEGRLSQFEPLPLFRQP